jgi:predicted protein tyrosine phosphatase
LPVRPRILIANLEEAALLALEFDTVITAGPQADEVAEWFTHPDHLVVEFHDVVHRGWGGPTRADVRTILDFAATRVDRSILIHCHAGMSRSTATAIAILTSWGLSPAEAFEHARTARPAEAHEEGRPFIPNALLLSHADALLDSGLLDHDPEIARELLYAGDDDWDPAWDVDEESWPA